MDYDKLEVVYVDTYEKEAIVFEWSVKGLGFGEISFHYGENGELECMNEYMSKDFVKRILCDFVDRAKFMEGRDMEDREDR